MKKTVFLLYFILLYTNHLQAQETCGTDIIFQKQAKDHFEITLLERQSENIIQNAIHRINLSKYAKTTADTSYYDIPVVVHIVHDYGAEYINDDSIVSYFNEWKTVLAGENDDTSNVITPFKKYVGTSRIRLHLATIDPLGNPTKGITRFHSYLTNNGSDQSKFQLWPTDSYLNIWFVRSFSTQSAGLSAYSYYPSSASFYPYYDGIIALYSYGNAYRTIPHEMGHFLNLQHPWGNNNQPGVACGDDFVLDTPPTKGHYSAVCTPAIVFDTVCASGYVALTSEGLVDFPDTANTQNMMDYAGGCRFMFTKGQVERMKLALNSSIADRDNLFTSDNLAITGALNSVQDLAPIADFSIEKLNPLIVERPYFLCQSHSIPFLFKNRSWNDTIINVEWKFSNGATIPVSNNIDTIANKFLLPGWVSVTLMVTGNHTETDTLVQPYAVYVADTIAVDPAIYVQDFTGPVNNWPMFNYFDNQFKWELFQGAGVGDTSCIRYHSYDNRFSPQNLTGTPIGDYDDIFSPGFNLLHSSDHMFLNFYTAGSFNGSQNYPKDSLQIFMSNDCGSSWKLIAVKKGTDLINNQKTDWGEFIPSSPNEWKPQTILIPGNYKSNKVFFKFRYWPSDNGNNLYMDKFKISPFSTQITEISENSGMTIFPNPSAGDCNVEFKTGIDAVAHCIIMDMAGKIIYQKTYQNISGPDTRLLLSNNLFHGSGFYFLFIKTLEKSYYGKIFIK